jgi:Protein of unknown function (DUF2934)
MAENAMPNRDLITGKTAEPLVGMADSDTAGHGHEHQEQHRRFGQCGARLPDAPDPDVVIRIKPDRRRTARVVSDVDIARRAYELYEQRGGGHGHDVADWLQAENELRLSPPTRRSP